MKLLLIFIVALIISGCTTSPVQYIEIEPEQIEIIDSLSKYDGFWIIPIPENVNYCKIEFSISKNYWTKWTGKILFNYKSHQIEVYDYNMALKGRFYRITYWKN